MSSHNAETVELAEIDQRGTIIEPRRTLTFPVPTLMSSWSRLRFGIAFSLTDLVDAEAALSDVSSNITSTDNALSSKFWFGFSTSPDGVIPGSSGFDGYTFVGLFPRKADWQEGTMMNDRGVLSDRLGSTTLSRTFYTGVIVGNEAVSQDTTSDKWWGILTEGEFSRYRNERLTILGYDVTIKNRGESNQAADIKQIGHAVTASTQIGMVYMNYGDFTRQNFVNKVSAATTHGEENIDLTDSGSPVEVPQNIVFHWPFYDQWRLRLHGAVLINYS